MLVLEARPWGLVWALLGGAALLVVLGLAALARARSGQRDQPTTR